MSRDPDEWIASSKLAMQMNVKNLRNVEFLNLETRVIVCSGSVECNDEIILDYDWDPPDCHLCGEEIKPNGDFMFRNNQRFEVYWRNDFSWGDEDDKHLLGGMQCIYCFNYFHRHKCSFSMSDDSVIASYIKKSWACALCVPLMIKCIFNNKDTD